MPEFVKNRKQGVPCIEGPNCYIACGQYKVVLKAYVNADNVRVLPRAICIKHYMGSAIRTNHIDTVKSFPGYEKLPIEEQDLIGMYAAIFL